MVTTQNLETRSFFDIQYKKLLVQNIQTIGFQLRTETEILVHFCGKGQVVLTLKFKKIRLTEEFYSNQVYLHHFASYNEQRGSRIGALAACIGRVTLPFAKKYVLPAAKKIDKEMLVQFRVSPRSLIFLQSENRQLRLLKQL